MALTDELLQSMTRSGEFSLRFNTAVDPQTMLEILLCLENREPRKEHMISGFPKVVNGDKTGKPSKARFSRKY